MIYIGVLRLALLICWKIQPVMMTSLLILALQKICFVLKTDKPNRLRLILSNGSFYTQINVLFWIVGWKCLSGWEETPLLMTEKSASGVADELISGIDQLKPQIIRVIEGFETVLFKSKFDSWPQTPDVTVSKDWTWQGSSTSETSRSKCQGSVDG